MDKAHSASCRAWRSAEGERRRERSGSVSSVEALGPRSRCRALTEEAKTLCFLQFSSLFGPKVPRVDLLGSLWIFYRRKARRVYSQKPSNRIGYSGVFCDILRLFDGYCWKSDEDLTEGLRDDRVREILQKKNSKSLPFPYFNFSIFFFFQKIDERLNEIRRSQKSCTSRSIDFTHVKLKTPSMPFTMYVREFGAAWPNPDFRPFAGRPPVKSKCMGFAGVTAY